MQGAYGGIICILTYQGGITAEVEDFSLLTENDEFILTNLSKDILATEGP